MTGVPGVTGVTGVTVVAVDLIIVCVLAFREVVLPGVLLVI